MSFFHKDLFDARFTVFYFFYANCKKKLIEIVKYISKFDCSRAPPFLDLQNPKKCIRPC
jgi:hypothetical protein